MIKQMRLEDIFSVLFKEELIQLLEIFTIESELVGFNCSSIESYFAV